MTHPLFRQEIFVGTPFAQRFQAMLRSSLHKRSWHVLVADPGSGKTVGIRNLVQTTGAPVILAVTAPKNNDDEQALGNQLFTALGLKSRGRWNERKPTLIGSMVQFGTKLLIVDDAQDLSLEHLMFIKEVTDQGRLQYGYPLGLCLVTAGRGNAIPLKEILDQPDPTWLQFRRRLDPLEPFCRIAGHTSEEVREILAALETVYRELLPQLNLHRWSGAMYTWLTQPVLDPTNSGRVTMDYLMKLVTTALEWTYQAGEQDVRAETLEKTIELLVLRRDTLRIIDGAGPTLEATPSESRDVAQASGTEPERETVSADVQAPVTGTEETVEEQVQTGKTPRCTFSGIVSIDLERFLASSTHLVECPGCGRTRTLSPKNGVLRFSPHDRRKKETPHTEQRWAMEKTDWDVVGG